MLIDQLDLHNLPLPITLRPSHPFTAEDLMRFSRRNKPYRIERTKAEEITTMTPVAGIGGNHEYPGGCSHNVSTEQI